jgi:hypothetical protein
MRFVNNVAENNQYLHCCTAQHPQLQSVPLHVWTKIDHQQVGIIHKFNKSKNWTNTVFLFYNSIRSSVPTYVNVCCPDFKTFRITLQSGTHFRNVRMNPIEGPLFRPFLSTRQNTGPGLFVCLFVWIQSSIHPSYRVVHSAILTVSRLHSAEWLFYDELERIWKETVVS